MNQLKIILLVLLMLIIYKGSAQYGFGTDNPDPSAVIDATAAEKGLLVPRVALVSTSNESPVTNPATSLLIYNTASVNDVTPGYYYWDGSKWMSLLTTTTPIQTVVSKTIDDTLSKTDNMVVASGDITLTMPVITGTDNGVEISVKNIGTYTDLIIVRGNDGATIDGMDSTQITRWKGLTYVANDGNWIIKNSEKKAHDLLDVSETGSWVSIDEVVAFLDEHMAASAVVRLSDETYEISETQVIDLPYALTFQGLSYGTSVIAAASGLENKPMFRCFSDCYFKMLSFDASTLENYGDNPGEDAIRFVGDQSYNEIKDSDFNHFNIGILDSTDAELWIFEADFYEAMHAGIQLTGENDSVTCKISEVDFTDCARGIELKKGLDARFSLTNCGFYNALSTDSAIIYRPETFSFSTIYIVNCTWNNTGTFVEGFDFTRSDGRDANAYIQHNAGMENQNPHCKVDVTNNSATTYLEYNYNWYKVNWSTNTFTYTCKWTIDLNRITYQPENTRDAVIYLSGSISSNTQNRTISVCIVKNGDTNSRYGETTLRITTANQPFQWSTVIYLEDVSENDYFEIFSNCINNGLTLTFQDVYWFTDTR